VPPVRASSYAARHVFPRAESRLTPRDRAADELDRADPILTLGSDLVADEEGSVGPAHEHGPCELELLDDGRQAARPRPGVRVVLGPGNYDLTGTPAGGKPQGVTLKIVS
jgi:hypothetical protein